LAAAGIAPDEVVTDDSVLYPRVPGTVWPQDAHPLCHVHETRRLTKAVQEAIRQVRKGATPGATISTDCIRLGGLLHADPPSDDPDDSAVHYCSYTLQAPTIPLHGAPHWQERWA
jgi:hypothetical protein